MLKSARKIVLLGRRKLFSPKEVERVITWLGDSLFAKGEFVLALKNFKEALQMLEHTSFSPNQAKLNFSICLCLEQAGKHLDALKHCEISVAMCKELMKKMKTVDEEIGDLSTLAQKKLKVLTDVVEKLRLKTARLWVRARDVEGEREEEPATFLAKKRRLEDVMSLTRVFGP